MVEATTRVGMPLDEFLELFSRQPFELINGEKKIIMPGVAGPNYVLWLLVRLLEQYLGIHTSEARGEVFYEMSFILPDTYDSNWVRGSRTPDIMVYLGERWAEYVQSNPDWREKPYMMIPDFVVEVVSPNDHYSDIDEKVDSYLKDGVRLIWVIDPQRLKATVYSAADPRPLPLTGDALLSGGDVLPGFEMRLAALFE